MRKDVGHGDINWIKTMGQRTKNIGPARTNFSSFLFHAPICPECVNLILQVVFLFLLIRFWVTWNMIHFPLFEMNKLKQ